MKRMTAFFLTCCLLLTPVLADEPAGGLLIAPNPMAEAQTAARELYDLGLFLGTGTDENGQPVFSLDRTLTRQEAVIMLVRLLGKEAEAKASGYPSPFADHADWASDYISYAWVFSLTLGNGDGTFGGEREATVAQFITFLLRALGYTTPGDFVWEQALAKAEEIGLSDGRWTEPDLPITRADAALLSRTALDLNTKSGRLLREAIGDAAAVGDGYTNSNPTFSGCGGSSAKSGIAISDEAGTGLGWKKIMKAANDLDITAGDGKIRVLIVHTHGTESYSEADGLEYKDTGDHRTTDDQRNLIQVGQVMTDALNSRGIGTVHLTDYTDYPKYVGAYDRMEDKIAEYLTKYPDVEMIIDMHRDAARRDGLPLRSLATVNGFETAQLMFVCGSAYEGWQGRTGIALGIHDMMEQRYPGIMRPLILRKSRYNQSMSPGSLLVEVGADGNTLSEAIYSARLLADVVADYLTEN